MREAFDQYTLKSPFAGFASLFEGDRILPLLGNFLGAVQVTFFFVFLKLARLKGQFLCIKRHRRIAFEGLLKVIDKKIERRMSDLLTHGTGASIRVFARVFSGIFFCHRPRAQDHY
jgi:hypothetical protein